MGCRKNQASLTAAEKAAFVNAVLQLKTAVPSQLHPGDANLHRYDDYVEVHMNAMMRMDGSDRVPGWAHRAPAFFPWHRELLRHLELDLQTIDPTVTLPYWDWTTDQSSDPVAGSPWTDDFMGAKDPTTDRVTTGPFRAGVWVKRVFEAGDTDPDLRRALGRTAFGAGATALPSDAQVYGPTGALTEVPYDSNPWNLGASPSFRDRAEGWHGAGSIHNRVHLWVGGSMLPSTSPNDPIFFLHHCNVDRLWNQWQQRHPSEGYHPTGVGGEVGPLGHNLNDAMLFNDPGQTTPWTPSLTPASLLNNHLPPSSYWYDTDPPEVTLLTPSLSFINIPEGIGGTGVTAYRAIQFEVLSCAGVTFQVTAGPTAPFTAPLGLTVTVPSAHQAPPVTARLWIAYTATTQGASAVGSAVVHCVETNQDFTVTLTANTVARPKAAMVLVLDHSGSMSEDAGDGNPKVAKLKQALLSFASVMLPGDGLGIVRFDDTVQRLSDVIDVGPLSPITPGSGRDRINQIVAGPDLDPAGATSIGGGVQEGRLALDTAPVTTPPYSVKAMLVVTDGVENTSPSIADVMSSINANTFAIGIGTPANISVPALQALTQGHGGYLTVTGPITADQSFRLTKYFLQALAGITNAQVVVDPQGELVFGAVHRVPFTVVDADMGIDVILLSSAAHVIDFVLETPAGDLITPAQVGVEPAVQFVIQRDLSFYRVSLPALQAAPQGSGTGQWHALLSIGVRRETHDIGVAAGTRRALPYSLLVHAYSTLIFRASLQQHSFEPGASVRVQASLAEYEAPVEQRAIVWSEITSPEGVVSILSMTEEDGGRFSATFTTAVPGVYVVRVRATGSTFTGRPFQREQTLTATAAPGADQPPRDDSSIDWLRQRDERLCQLLLCLLDEAALGRVLLERGGNLDVIRSCIKRYLCPGERTVAEPRREPERRVEMTPRQLPIQAVEAIAQLPEAEPVPAWVPTPPRRELPEGVMFALSPEDQAAGEPAEPETPPARPQPRRGAARRPRPAHELSPEDRATGEEGGETPTEGRPDNDR